MIENIELKITQLGHDKYHEIVKYIESTDLFTFVSDRKKAFNVKNIGEPRTSGNRTVYSDVTLSYHQPAKEDEVDTGKKLLAGLVDIILREENEIK